MYIYIYIYYYYYYYYYYNYCISCEFLASALADLLSVQFE